MGHRVLPYLLEPASLGSPIRCITSPRSPVLLAEDPGVTLSDRSNADVTGDWGDSSRSGLVVDAGRKGSQGIEGGAAMKESPLPPFVPLAPNRTALAPNESVSSRVPIAPAAALRPSAWAASRGELMRSVSIRSDDAVSDRVFLGGEGNSKSIKSGTDDLVEVVLFSRPRRSPEAAGCARGPNVNASPLRSGDDTAELQLEPTLGEPMLGEVNAHSVLSGEVILLLERQLGLNRRLLPGELKGLSIFSMLKRCPRWQKTHSTLHLHAEQFIHRQKHEEFDNRQEDRDAT